MMCGSRLLFLFVVAFVAVGLAGMAHGQCSHGDLDGSGTLERPVNGRLRLVLVGRDVDDSEGHVLEPGTVAYDVRYLGRRQSLLVDFIEDLDDPIDNLNSLYRECSRIAGVDP